MPRPRGSQAAAIRGTPAGGRKRAIPPACPRMLTRTNTPSVTTMTTKVETQRLGQFELPCQKIKFGISKLGRSLLVGWAPLFLRLKRL